MSVERGNTVTLRYVGALADGTEFDRSAPDTTLVFEVGAGVVIPGLEEAVLGREKGASFDMELSCEKAFGPHMLELVFPVPLNHVPGNLDLEPGVMLHVSTDQGELEGVVTGIRDSDLLVDANHPLAGQTLYLNVIIDDII